MNKEIKGFSFYKSYFEALDEMEEEIKKDILLAIINYVFKDEIPEFIGIKKSIWKLIEPNLNTSKNRSNSNAGAKNGNDNAKKTIKKQSKNNQKTINDLKDISLSLSLSNSLSNNNINNNNNNNLDNINIYEYWENNFGTLGGLIPDKLQSWEKKIGNEMLILAMNECIERNAKSFSYLEAILNNWKTSGYKIPSDIKSKETKKEESWKKALEETFKEIEKEKECK